MRSVIGYFVKRLVLYSCILYISFRVYVLLQKSGQHTWTTYNRKMYLSYRGVERIEIIHKIAFHSDGI